jgi:hypothetical protein
MNRSTYLRMVPMGLIGATNPSFAPGVTSDSAGGALQDAAASLLNYFDTYGVPSEHVSDPNVVAFQTQWNADAGNAAAAAKLDVDGGYGANVHDALNVLTGGIAPNVNTGAAPIGPTPNVPPTPLSTAGVGGGMGLFVVLALVAGGAYLLTRKKRTTSVIVRRNPGRRARRRML